MRGKVFKIQTFFRYCRITPAHAGKSLVNFDYTHHIKDHPRTCGEKKHLNDFFTRLLGSPPHMRGKGGVIEISCKVDGITPAHVGKR